MKTWMKTYVWGIARGAQQRQLRLRRHIVRKRCITHPLFGQSSEPVHIGQEVLGVHG